MKGLKGELMRSLSVKKLIEGKRIGSDRFYDEAACYITLLNGNKYEKIVHCQDAERLGISTIMRKKHVF